MQVLSDIRTAARAIRGSSWPGEMAQSMEDRARRLDLYVESLSDVFESAAAWCPSHNRYGCYHPAAAAPGGAPEPPPAEVVELVLQEVLDPDEACDTAMLLVQRGMVSPVGTYADPARTPYAPGAYTARAPAGGTPEEPPVGRRIDLTLVDGDLWDAHQHEHGDPAGDGPFVNLDIGEPKGRPEHKSWSLVADEWAVTIVVRPAPKPAPPLPQPATSHDRGHR